ncbi:GLPGLI family protein [Saccharicrinis carchari]|uniref:GLPGLI family protein n=1 Tax=Saccharicrinis carchari TaxID=1168039 RepID=A0A521BVC0_SACCC|nr:hypothetical protein [Saccharicrinis carchari]SMO51154.1 GLPGLI family protein [Saccharicrinis carchari]
MRFISYIIILLILLQACANSSQRSDFPNAGEITYRIHYPEEISESPTSNLMPGELILRFNDNMRRYSFKGSFNIFSLDFYSLSPSDSCATIFRFMDNHLLDMGSSESNFFFFDKANEPIIKLIDGPTKDIAGVPCLEATINYPGKETFSVFYTKSINLNMPNRNTPFDKIPGVLMEFFVNYNGVRFHFTAQNIDFIPPEESEFELPDGAKHTSEKEIEGMILTLINNFK